MPDLHYTDPILAAVYDLDSGWSEDRDFYLARAGPPPQRILDLGCGTGLLAEAFAGLGHQMTGVDPAAAMLDVARAKPLASRISYVQSTAQNFRSDQRFDLIIMTGHAFQVLLTDADIAATFATMRDHLAPNGRIVFESRNPALDWATVWNTDRRYMLQGKTVQETRRVVSANGNLISFDTDYVIHRESRRSSSTLLFLRAPEITARLTAAGLQVQDLFGDWQSGPFAPDTSAEMVFVVGHG